MLFKNRMKVIQSSDDSDLAPFLLLVLEFFDILDKSLFVNLLAVSIAQSLLVMHHIPDQRTCRP